MLTLVALLVVLGVLIFVHELGHFMAAKWAGIYVHRFSLGLGSPIPWLTRKVGETEYAISWLPLGGYVKMASHEEDAMVNLEGQPTEASVPKDRVYEAKPVWQRMIVILAGVTMNALFAWAVYSGLAAKNGRQLDPTTTVGRVLADSLPKGAEGVAQLRPGDRILAVNGVPAKHWQDVESGIAQASGRAVALTLADGRTVTLDIHQDALEVRIAAAQAVLPYRAPVIGDVLPNRPAATAGLQVGDTITAFDGEPVVQWYDLQQRIEGSVGRTVALRVSRGGAPVTLQVTPSADTLRGDGGRVLKVVGRIGVQVGNPVVREPYRGLEPLQAGLTATLDTGRQIWRSLKGLVSGRVSTNALGGPIAIGQMAGQSARLGLDAFFAYMALISVNLALFNLLPVPVLDGGQFLFLVAEAIIRRPLPLVVRERLTQFGVLLMGLLVVFAFSNDIRRLFGW